MTKPRRIRVTPERRSKPDHRKMSAALQAYLAAQAEVDAETEHRRIKPKPRGGQS
jgi:hypothetical protein